MLTPALLQPLLAGVSRTLVRDDAQAPEAAAALLEAFHPQTPLQAMLAFQAIALHHAAMDCFARAMEAEPEDHATAARMQRNAASLTRAFTATLRTIQRCQALPPRGHNSGHDMEDHMQPEPPPHQPEPEPASVRHNAQQDPVQRENPAPPAWEHLTEAEQFAILNPERAAAGATSHEDADLWLPQFAATPHKLRAAR
jgi:hypothetical protein